VSAVGSLAAIEKKKKSAFAGSRTPIPRRQSLYQQTVMFDIIYNRGLGNVVSRSECQVTHSSLSCFLFFSVWNGLLLPV
jgi:hypothetical protein